MSIDTDTPHTDAEEHPVPDTSDIDDADEGARWGRPATPRRRIAWARIVVFGVLPALALTLTLGAGYAKWRNDSVRDAESAGGAALRAATDGTIALLSYRPDTVEADLSAASDHLTGAFRDTYGELTADVVIPGARQRLITAVATVPAAAVVTADVNRAVILAFVNQTTTIGDGAPADTASSVRVTLDKIGDAWFISGFDPV